MDLALLIEKLDIQDDFDQFIKFILDNPFKLTAKGTIPSKECVEIDSLMAWKSPYPNPKSPFKEYPLLVLFVEILLKAEIFSIEKRKGGLFFVPDHENLSYYLTFNKIEKYFFLLHFFLNECAYANISGGDVRESARFSAINMDILIGGMANALILLTNELYGRDMRYLSTYFSYFGLLEIKYDKYLRFYSTNPKTTSLGKKICTILFKKRKTIFWNKKALLFPALTYSYSSFNDMLFIFAKNYQYAVTKGGEEEEIDLKLIAETEIKKANEEYFIDAFVPYFPANQLTKYIEYKNNLQPIIGNYIFQIAINSKVWRKIAIAGKDTLEDLHLAIQDAFNFDNDHLCAFYLDGNPYSNYAYKDLREGEGLDASEVTIQDLYLESGQKILYIFDFGNN